jgi:uncharacterized protein DUF3667
MPRCLNCGEAVGQAYCGICGQPLRSRRHGLRVILGDYISNVFAADSRLFRSLINLFLHPGALTEQNLQGRWVSYLPPFRMYLFFSMIFAFVFFQTLDQQTLNFSDSTSTAIEISTTSENPAPPETAATSEDPASPEIAAVPESPSSTLEPSTSPQNPIDVANGSQPSWLQRHIFGPVELRAKRLQQMDKNEISKALNREMDRSLPIILLLAIPLFALGMKLFYLFSKRLYFEHFVFGLHYYSFGLATLTVARLLGSGWLNAALALLIFPGYTYLALRRVYRQSKLLTLVKVGMVGILHFFIFLSVLITVSIYAFLNV